ncbi:hypothetical protein [Clostridium drakei]|uniref:Uncharacterized protein n=1 Tax=Clostridium drakei TaxID=332101 RepID=A0A2U8DLU9_9CLOT|nr:hypothetical protein [Clostridium drakei]AWI03669.1 hypothetical protein B9W14_03945 [Clostridium drakei]
MEYRLNKIDPEVRQRVKDTTKPGKVHNKTGIAINKDNKDRNKKNQGDADFGSKLEKQRNKNKISVDAVKVDEMQVSVYKEDVENLSKDEIKGNILDTRK